MHRDASVGLIVEALKMRKFSDVEDADGAGGEDCARGLHHSPGCDDAAETVYVSQLKRQRLRVYVEVVASLVNLAFYSHLGLTPSLFGR